MSRVAMSPVATRRVAMRRVAMHRVACPVAATPRVKLNPLSQPGKLKKAVVALKVKASGKPAMKSLAVHSVVIRRAAALKTERTERKVTALTHLRPARAATPEMTNLMAH